MINGKKMVRVFDEFWCKTAAWNMWNPPSGPDESEGGFSGVGSAGKVCCVTEPYEVCRYFCCLMQLASAAASAKAVAAAAE